MCNTYNKMFVLETTQESFKRWVEVYSYKGANCPPKTVLRTGKQILEQDKNRESVLMN